MDEQATEKQIEFIKKLVAEKTQPSTFDGARNAAIKTAIRPNYDGLSKSDASKIIDWLKSGMKYRHINVSKFAPATAVLQFIGNNAVAIMKIADVTLTDDIFTGFQKFLGNDIIAFGNQLTSADYDRSAMQMFEHFYGRAVRRGNGDHTYEFAAAVPAPKIWTYRELITKSIR